MGVVTWVNCLEDMRLIQRDASFACILQLSASEFVPFVSLQGKVGHVHTSSVTLYTPFPQFDPYIQPLNAPPLLVKPQITLLFSSLFLLLLSYFPSIRFLPLIVH